jgi:hypothetical protein
MRDQLIHEMELFPLSDHAWRLCDRTVPHDDAASVIAYLERTEQGIEVVWLRPGAEGDRFEALKDAIAAARLVLAEPQSAHSR